jgi:hypothetical protein
MLATAGGLYFGQLSVKMYGGRASSFKIDLEEETMFGEDKISATLWIPSTDRVLVSVQDKQKLYLVNHNKGTKEPIVPSQPFTGNVVSLNILDEHFVLVRDSKFMYVVDTLKKKAFRLFESSY